MDNNSLAHTKWNSKYHIVFTPKYRRQIIYKQISADIGSIIRTLCARKGVENRSGGNARSHSPLCGNSTEVQCSRIRRLSKGKE